MEEPGKAIIPFTIENRSNAPALSVVAEGALVPTAEGSITTFNGRFYDQSLVLPGSTKEFKFELAEPQPGVVYNGVLEAKISIRIIISYQDVFKHSYRLTQEFIYREGKLRPIHTGIQGIDGLSQ